MGGVGSGRRCSHRRQQPVNKHRSIDVRHWHREGLLEPESRFVSHWLRHGQPVASIHVTAWEGEVELDYQYNSHRKEAVEHRYPITLARTPCHLGGDRPWFLCPTDGCSRRVAILYLSHGRFACRHCLKLAYQSQRETETDRHVRRANKLRRYMGWPPGILSLPGVRPKGMHWKTYARLVLEYGDVSEVALRGVMAQVKL